MCKCDERARAFYAYFRSNGLGYTKRSLSSFTPAYLLSPALALALPVYCGQPINHMNIEKNPRQTNGQNDRY